MVGPMMKHRIFHWLLRAFALGRPRDYWVKPLAVTAVLLGLFALLALFGFGQDMATLPAAMSTVALVQLPFTALAFAMVTYMDRVQTQLAALAMTDVLTGLPNRRAFVAQAGRAQANGEAGFVLIIDADHFKRINDTYGHAVGDRCLQAIAKRLNDVRRADDLIGRIGGEEFGAFMPLCTMAELRRISGQLCHAILINLPEERDPLRLTLSVGAAETRPLEMIEAALSRADEALYLAKAEGRARLVVWSKAVTDRVA